MLNALKKLLAGEQNESRRAPLTASELPDEDRLIAFAAAMLLFEVAWADHDMADEEIASIKQSLHKLFDLSAENTEWIVNDARAKHEESVGVYEYTRTINEELNAEEKFALIVALWQLANSDQQIEALEEHSIRRISELLYVPHAKFISAKQAARNL